MKLTVSALCCAASTLTVFAPSAGAAPLSGRGDEICQVVGDNGGTYFLSVTSRREARFAYHRNGDGESVRARALRVAEDAGRVGRSGSRTGSTGLARLLGCPALPGVS